MDGIRIVIDTSELDRIVPYFSRLGHLDRAALLSDIGALGESQTRRRITDEKTSPDGAPWPPNLAGTPILVESGQHLLASVAFIAGGADEVQWGAGWEFAHVHQSGATIEAKNAAALVFKIGERTVGAKSVTIPPRPFVGLSAENAEEIEELVTDVIAGMLGGRR